jgi:ribonuclease P/MRP protein subunit RPP1
MYEAIHARPDGASTVSRMALTAAEHGFTGIVVRNHGDTPASFDPASIREEFEIDVVTGVEIRADSPGQAGSFVGSQREDTTIVAIHGGDPAINRFAVEQPKVDVLAHPMADEGGFNHVLAAEAVENDVYVEFNFSDVLRSSGGSRVQALQDMRRLREVIEAYDVPFVVSADPRSHLEFRAPRELRAVGEEIGFSPEQIDIGLEAWDEIAARNRERLSDSFVQPGVWRVDDDGDDADES